MAQGVVFAVRSFLDTEAPATPRRCSRRVRGKQLGPGGRACCTASGAIGPCSVLTASVIQNRLARAGPEDLPERSVQVRAILTVHDHLNNATLNKTQRN